MAPIKIKFINITTVVQLLKKKNKTQVVRVFVLPFILGYSKPNGSSFNSF